jgi:signal transduction histidine kinase
VRGAFGTVGGVRGSGTWWPIVAVLACLAAAVLAARLAQVRRAFTEALEERGWLLERERQSAARSAVDAERSRIAHDLHDVVSHSVSVMLIQAAAAREVLGVAPDEAAEALVAVEAAGRDTMTELRHLLGVLAPPADGEPGNLSPPPGLGRLSPLVDRIAFAGLPVEVRISGEPRPLPAGVDLTAYRIIQEALTNALKHGDDGTQAQVTVRYAPRYLRVEVLNSGSSVLSGGRDAAAPRKRDDPARTDAGRGLLGLQQRVAVFGGELDARRRLGGGFRVRARIPLERP